MARGKKKEKILTQEEKLQQALVPECEWPYKVPENWLWTRVVYCCEDLFSGKSPKYSKEQTAFPIIGQQANQRYGIDLKYVKYGTEEFGLSQNERFFLRYNDVILNTLGTGSIGRSGIYKLSVRMLTDGHPFVFRTGDRFLPDLLYYYFQVNEEHIINTANGSTNQKFLSLSSFSRYPVPLPPLAEQQRIVDSIESLFAKLDEAKEKAQAVVDGFEDRKAAILHRAFTGELTTEWRSERNIELSTWKSVLMQDVCEKITCGKTPKEFIHSKGEIPYLKVYNIVNNEVDFVNAPQFIPAEIHNGKLSSSILKPNDVIMNIVGPPLRKIAIIPETYKEWNMNQAIVRFRPKECLYYRYLYYALINPETLDGLIIATRGVVGQANISVSQSRNLKISLPTMEEQKEIVRILDTILVSETRTKEVAEQAIDQINTMKKSILSRAFRGELGTNNRVDESAEELLKRILE